MKHHIKHMAIAGGAILAVLLALRVDARSAVQYAILLSCPLGMIGMMFMMNKGHGGHDHGAKDDDHCAGHEEGSGDASSNPHQEGFAVSSGYPNPDHDVPQRPLTRENHERLP
jgi:hypothetical protein